MEAKLYQQVVETMAQGIAVVDAETTLVFVNQELCDLSGYAMEELVGRPSAEFIAPDQRMEFSFQVARRRQGVSHPYETVVVSREGEEIPILVSPQPLFDDSGEFLGSFAVVSDISTTRRTEVEREVISQIIRGIVVTSNLDELLELIHRSLEKVIYAENCFVALLDDSNDTIYFPYFADKFDEFQEPIRRGKTCTDYVLRTGRPLLLSQERFDELVEQGEVELVGSNSPSWMGVPLMTPTRTIGVLAVQHYEDVGAFSETDLEFFGSVGGHIALAIERKRAEEKLYSTQELYTNVVESMSDGVLVLDSDFHFLYWNRAMESLATVPREEVVRNGRLPWEIFPHLKDLGVDRMMRRAMAGEAQRATNLEHHLENGRSLVTNETYRPFRGADGEIRGVVGVVRDVTERRVAEQALRKSEEQLRQAQKMEAIGRLAGGIAHDFNNLLTAINGYSELVLERLPEQDPIHEQICEIRKAGEHAAELTQQLLAFSRKQVIQPKVIDLNQQVTDLQAMLCRLIGEDIELVTELEPDLHHVMTDTGQFEQVVVNLVVNARDAMPTGGKVILRTENRELNGDVPEEEVIPGHYVGLTVTDTGMGMEPEIAEQIFEPFFTTKEMGKGTGMGLSTVYGIVRQNGGYVWVDSEPGQGTTISMYLPRTMESLTTAQDAGARAEPLAGSETVLVVEDEAAVRSLMRLVLEQHGYRVLEASDAEEALKIFDHLEAPLDLLLSDVVMPHMSGPTLAAKIQERQANLKVLFISGHADETIVQHGVLLPDTELLVKPFSVKDLVVRVHEVLHQWSPEERQAGSSSAGRTPEKSMQSG